MPTSYENIESVKTKRDYFDLFYRKSGYVILKFHTGESRHFCIISELTADGIEVYNPQIGRDESLRFNNADKRYYWDDFSRWQLKDCQELL
jgi:hypothetical protein